MITPQPLWQTLLPIPPLEVAAVTLVIGYLIFEVGFFIHYKWQLVPRANRISFRPPAPYRDYPNAQDRGKLLKRILLRLLERIPFDEHETDVAAFNVESYDAAFEVYYEFIQSWFEKKGEDVVYQKFSEQFDMGPIDGGLCPPPPALRRMATSLGYMSTTDDESNECSSDEETSEREPSNIWKKEDYVGNTDNDPTDHENAKIHIGGIKKENMDELFAWAFFGVPLSAMQSTPSMQKALDDLHVIIQSHMGFTFEPGKNPNYKLRSFTFDEVNSIYRPFLVYACVALMRTIANCILYIMGFRHYSCKRGLRYWHRPSLQRPLSFPFLFHDNKTTTEEEETKGKSPFLFFHGMAPGGYAPYLPMIFAGILKSQHRNRDMFIFENNPIASMLCFGALSEEDTVQGVLEAVQTHLGSSPKANNLTLCGHSFGSCQLAWMSKAPEMKKRIRSLVLLDPVSILLSEPDVVVNFLYAGQFIQYSDKGASSDSLAERLIRFFNENKIRFVAGSELCIEHYLRRHFAWYNSELWLHDIPEDVNVVVCLAECDEIVNAPKIEKHLASHNSRVGEVSRFIEPSCVHIETIVWRDVGHGHCVCNPESWCDIRNALWKTESHTKKE